MEYAIVEVKRECKKMLLPSEALKSHLIVKTLDICYVNKKQEYSEENLIQFQPYEHNDFDSTNTKHDYYLTRRVCPWHCKQDHSHLKDLRVYIKLLGKMFIKLIIFSIIFIGMGSFAG